MNRTRQRREERARSASIGEQLLALQTLSVGELADKYQELYGIPSRTRNKGYLRKRLAWRIQELAEGGLSDRALARIEELAPLAPVRWRTPKASVVSERDPRLPPVGTVLTRSYQGTVYEVTILEKGVEYRGETYSSLSRVARLITGTAWNGFAFFGLRPR